MRVDQFGELGKDFHNLIRTFTAGSDNNDIGFGLFGDSVLKHGLTRTERTGDKSRTAFYDRVYRIMVRTPVSNSLYGRGFSL